MIPSSLLKKILRTLRKPTLTDQQVLAARRRGWEKISPNLNDSFMIKSTKRLFPGKFLPVVWTFLILFAVGSITAGGYYTYLRQHGASDDLIASPGSEDIRARAAYRFKELAGMTLDQFKVSAAKADGNQVLVYYSERILTTVGDEADIIPYIARYFAPQPVSGKHPAIQYSKPLILKTWISPTFEKHAIYQDNKLLSYTMKNGQDLIEYKGGAFAVHANFPPNMQVGQDWSVGPGGVADLDLSLMQFIIDTNKDILPQPSLIDGKTTLKFAVPSSTTGSLLTMKTGLVSNDDNIVTTFYLDAETLHIIKVEGFYRDQRVIILTPVLNSIITDPNAQVDLTKNNELKGITIKEVKTEFPDGNYPEVYDEIPTEVLAKYPIYYQPSDDSLPQMWQDKSTVKDFNYYYNVVQLSREFNPVLEKDMIQRILFPDIGQYYQNRLGFEVSSQEFYDPEYPGAILMKEPISILLDDRSVPATYFTLSAGDFQRYFVTFKDAGIWYQASVFRDIDYLNKEDIRFKSFHP